MRQPIDTLPVAALCDVLRKAGELVSQSGPLDKLTISHLGHDSREVTTGGLFVALRGAQTDGHRFIDKAVQNGATAIVCETMPEALVSASGIACIRVRNARRALAHIAAHAYGYPSDDLLMVGITGTNGKSTSAWLIAHVLEGAGKKTGLLTTIHYRIGKHIIGTGLTTPDAISLQHTLRRMRDEGCEAVVMEVSSHALDQHRVDAVTFDVAVFTNLTRDHLDYHKSFESYLLSKKRLFDGLSSRALSIYNAQDAHGSRQIADTKAKKISFGSKPGVDFRSEIKKNAIDGLELNINNTLLRSRLVGAFNAQNLTAAYATACSIGVDPERALELLETAPAIPGRFERVDCEDNVIVIVDYAHTPDALSNALQTLRQIKPADASLWCLFGCGGDRDKGKRPQMGAVAADIADNIVITSDNPRTESPDEIIAGILKGMPSSSGRLVIPDRRTAIQFVCTNARPGDVVLIAGKGHETYQQIGDNRIPFDDRSEARRACRKRVPQSSPNTRT